MAERETSYTEEKGDAVCNIISCSSLSVKRICEQVGVDYTSFKRELQTNEALRTKYARAKQDQADHLVEEIIEISDDGTNDYMTIVKGDTEYNIEDKEVTNRSKLRVDARKWAASKLFPKKYGEKLDVTTDGKEINQKPVIIDWSQNVTDNNNKADS